MRLLLYNNNCIFNDIQRSSKLILALAWLSHSKGKLQLTYGYSALSCDQVVLHKHVYSVTVIGWESTRKNLLM